MHTWQVVVLFAMAGGAIVCLARIYRAIEKLAQGVLSLRIVLTTMNSKLESIEQVKGDDSELEAIEAAVSGFEKLKRVDLTRT